MFIRKGFVLQILLTFRINKVLITLIQIKIMTLSPFYIYTVVVLEPVSLKYYCIEILIIDTFLSTVVLKHFTPTQHFNLLKIN